ncbi:hypothetical protein QCN29_05130 [Streptomyces sp. HNM0663]|uniref:Uncharacterized protein n=1 Tax=Streptomyces chengmaiensis TaxID=3040919 RepID=A0ABT6HHE5_9ACTN|nr:hypothetical protein [Streptomyces chengmaiensis]MDH2388182.1 hypothetical protein [Streptomyces chengmaiensis]
MFNPEIGEYELRLAPPATTPQQTNNALSDSSVVDDIRAARIFHQILTKELSPGIGTPEDLITAVTRAGITLPLLPDRPSLTESPTVQLIEEFYDRLVKRVRGRTLVKEMKGLRSEVRKELPRHAIDMHPTLLEEPQHSTLPSPRKRRLGHLGEQNLGPEDAEIAAPAAEKTIEHSLALLFLRLGPPPEPTELDYSPAGHGGGGAQQ